MKPKLIIFDNDGVLIDSEIIWHRIHSVEMTRMGFPITVEKSIELFTGINKPDFAKLVLQEYGRSMLESDTAEIFKKAEESYPTDLKSVENISLVLDFLETKHINKCISSSGNKDYILMTLSLTNLIHYFESNCIFGLKEPHKRKPAPDVFLNAADHFKIEPKDCLVIEDHVFGIEAARAANMPVIGFLGASHARAPQYRECILKAKPMLVVDNSLELLQVLKNIYQ